MYVHICQPLADQVGVILGVNVTSSSPIACLGLNFLENFPGPPGLYAQQGRREPCTNRRDFCSLVKRSFFTES